MVIADEVLEACSVQDQGAHFAFDSANLAGSDLGPLAVVAACLRPARWPDVSSRSSAAPIHAGRQSTISCSAKRERMLSPGISPRTA